MSTHPAPDVISLYAAGSAELDDASAWALEAHLESCAVCRARLAQAVDVPTLDLIRTTALGLSGVLATGPAPAPRRRLPRTGVVFRVLPWVLVSGLLVLTAVGFEHAFASLPSLVLLIAPVAPLIPIAAVWSRRLDPAWEVLSTLPRGGLWLLLRRTLVALLSVLPILAVSGRLSGEPVALWLLPCLAFTAGTLALGALIGVDRAALALAGLWTVAVVAPSLANQQLSIVLTGSSTPAWTVATLALLTALAARLRAGYRFRS